jgi:dTDP-4-dehydrorhamnose reductase
MTSELELWGGVECTVNRVGERYRDQLRLTGHHDRLEDLDLIAGLGVTALRFPVLWERVQPVEDGPYDWTWSDSRLRRLEVLGIRPILGLLHHGSGPAHTSLVDPGFPAAFAGYAAAVARRYPDVLDWTPLNEPLTTARFSCLYGTWYPHARDTGQFWRAVVTQAEATVAAMAAIRDVIPGARLIQTDDLGRTMAESEVQEVADYYNHRRWLFWDLITGRVGPDHPLWDEGARLGLADRMRALAERPCPPAIVGVNHYPTSDRFLRARRGDWDITLDAPFEDLAAVRVADVTPPGVAGALREAWDRYGLPVAVTECHLGCTREEQLRWVRRTWDAAERLRREGADVRAVTAWALMGNQEWVNLLTLDSGHYESGVFDARGETARPTALARLFASLPRAAAGPKLVRPGRTLPPVPALAPDPTERRFAHIAALAREPGWWERDIRWLDAMQACAPGQPCPAPVAPPILITGATGTLGQALATACRLRGLNHVLTDRATLPLDDAEAIGRVLDRVRPWAVVNAAGWVRVDDAEEERDACYRANADGAATLAEACAERDIHCTLFSSDLVFGDDRQEPRCERAGVSPLNVYGASKAAAEARALHLAPETLVIRTAAFFSPFDRYNFAVHVEQVLRRGEVVRASDDHVVTPTYVPDLVMATLDLIIDGETGLWHLANEEPVSWLGFGRRVARVMGLDPARVVSATPRELGWRARRPRYAALQSRRGRLLPSLDRSLEMFAAERHRMAQAQPAPMFQQMEMTA